MKKIYSSFLLISISTTIIFSQPSLQWESIFNGPIANDQGKAITVDGNGNVYVTGSSDGSTGSDYITIKYNSAGVQQWASVFNGSSNGTDVAVAIQVSNSGNVYVIGNSEGSGTGSDIVTIKYNSAGVEQWAKTFTGTGSSDDSAYNLIVDVFQNVYVAGRVGTAFSHGVVIKYNSQGVKLWDTGLYGSAGENKVLIARNSNNGNLIAVSSNSYFSHYNLQELDSDNGNSVFNYNWSTNNSKKGIPNALVLDGTGNIYVTSTSTGSISVGLPHVVTTTKFLYPGTGSGGYNWWQSTSVGNGQTLSGIDTKIDNNGNTYILAKWHTGSNYRFFTKKLTPTGTQVWQIFSSSGVDSIPTSLSLSNNLSNPDIYVTGYTGTGNIATIKYDNNGTLLWIKGYDCGNNGTDVASAMAIDDCENIYITGHSNCEGTYKDIKTIKYSAADAPLITPVGSINICPNSNVTLVAETCAGCTYLWSTGQTTQNIIASPSVTTDYTVTVFDQFGCSSISEPTTVTILPLPTITITGATTICAENSTILNASGASSYSWTPAIGLSNPNIANPTASPTITTTYTVTGTTNSCSNTEVVTVSVIPAPDVTVSDINTIVCEGSSIILNAYGAETYSWSPVTGLNNPNIASPTASPTVTTTYTVTGTLSNGCSDIATTTITVNPVPSITATGEATICVGNSTILNAYGVDNYSWSPTTGLNNPNIANPTASPTVTTTYTATGISNGCSATDTVTVTVVQESPPTPESITGSTSTCSGSSYTYSTPEIIGATSYSWTLPSGWTGIPFENSIVTTAGITSGDIFVTAVNQCGESNPLMLSITANSTPPQPSITQNSNTLTSDAPIGNQWFWGGIEIVGATNQTYTATIDGNYTVMVTINNCSSLLSSPPLPVTVTGVDQINSDYSINLYPNPTSTLLNIKGIGFENDNYILVLSNSLGQILNEMEYKSVNNLIGVQLNMAGLAGGVYFLTIKSERINSTYRVYKL